MNIYDIINVSTVYKTLSFTKAASRLNISQSAISQSIAKLENELNILLFIRKNNTLRPTSNCETFLKTGLQILELWQKLQSDMKIIAGRHNSHLRIGVSSFFFKLFSDQNDIFQGRKQPDFKYEIFQDDALNMENMILNGQLDFCFVRSPLQNKLLQWEHLFNEKILLAVSAKHPVCMRFKTKSDERFPVVDLREFQNIPFCMVNNPRITPSCIQMCEEAGFSPIITVRTHKWEQVYDYIQTGRAIGFISGLYAETNNKGLPVCFFRIDSPHASMEHVVAYLSKAMISPNARIFIDIIREQTAKKVNYLKDH